VGRSLVLRLQDLRFDSPGAILGLETWLQGRPTERLWKGQVADARGMSISLLTPPREAAQLVLSLEEPDSGVGKAPASATLTLIVDESNHLGDSRSRRPPDVFVYVVDTLRADALTPYGSARLTSPRIQEFARDAVLFRRAASTSSWTFPATMSILTGLLPSHHGHVAGQAPPDDDVPRLSRMAAAEGYETLALSQSAVVSGKERFEVGFQHFYLSDGLSRGGSESANIRWFLWRHLVSRQDANRPLFSYIHTVDPHAPYLPHGQDLRFARRSPGLLPSRYYHPQSFLRYRETLPDWEVRRLRALYDGEVAHADREFGAFLDFLKLVDLYDDSLIIFTSDHGEEFREHGGFSHERTLYQELLHVPLLVKFPRSWQAGTEVDTRVSLADIAPTVLDVIGARPDATSFDGDSLRSLATSGDRGLNRSVYSEVTRQGKKRWTSVDLKSVLVGDTKCIYSATGQSRFGDPVEPFRTFDLRYDPAEQQAEEMAPADPVDPVDPCQDLLRAWLQTHEAHEKASDDTKNEEELEHLRALGYIDD
jgi:arylsulfatase A-like enzyme